MRYQKIQTMADTVAEPVQVRQASDVAPIAREMIGDDLKIKEYFLAITLDGASNIISARIIHIGMLNQSLVHPRDVFRPAIMDNAAAVIVVHNHPSGQTTPSEADNRITDRLQEGGKLLGIELVDHIIVTEHDYYSYSEEAML